MVAIVPDTIPIVVFILISLEDNNATPYIREIHNSSPLLRLIVDHHTRETRKRNIISLIITKNGSYWNW